MKKNKRNHFASPLNPARPSRRRRMLALLGLSALAVMCAFPVLAQTQGDGAGGLAMASRMVSSYFEPAVKLVYAVGACIGLIGAVRVYGKFSSGDPDTAKTAASWFGACIFLIVCATVLRSFFGTGTGI